MLIRIEDALPRSRCSCIIQLYELLYQFGDDQQGTAAQTSVHSVDIAFIHLESGLGADSECPQRREIHSAHPYGYSDRDILIERHVRKSASSSMRYLAATNGISSPLRQAHAHPPPRLPTVFKSPFSSHSHPPSSELHSRRRTNPRCRRWRGTASCRARSRSRHTSNPPARRS